MKIVFANLNNQINCSTKNRNRKCSNLKPACTSDAFYRSGNPTYFKAKAEYTELEKNYGNHDSSCYFRWGKFFGYPSKNYEKVINAIKSVYENNKKPDILIVGVAKAQEPFSILAVIKSLNPSKPIKDSVNMSCVDLKPQITHKNLEEYAYYGHYKEPIFTKSSFINHQHPSTPVKRFKVLPEIQQYLQEVFDDTEKTKWDTKIQDFSQNGRPETYDIISINNILGYIPKSESMQTLENLLEMIKPNGIIVTDPLDK